MGLKSGEHNLGGILDGLGVLGVTTSKERVSISRSVEEQIDKHFKNKNIEVEKVTVLLTETSAQVLLYVSATNKGFVRYEVTNVKNIIKRETDVINVKLSIKTVP